MVVRLHNLGAPSAPEPPLPLPLLPPRAPSPASNGLQQEPQDGQLPDSFPVGYFGGLSQHAPGSSHAAGQLQSFQHETPRAPPASSRGDYSNDAMALLSRHALGSRPEPAQQPMRPPPARPAAAAPAARADSSYDPMAILLGHYLGAPKQQQAPQQQQVPQQQQALQQQQPYLPPVACKPSRMDISTSSEEQAPQQQQALPRAAPAHLSPRFASEQQQQQPQPQQQQQLPPPPQALPAAAPKASPIYDPVLTRCALPDAQQPGRPPAQHPSRSACMVATCSNLACFGMGSTCMFCMPGKSACTTSSSQVNMHGHSRCSKLSLDKQHCMRDPP